LEYPKFRGPEKIGTADNLPTPQENPLTQISPVCRPHGRGEDQPYLTVKEVASMMRVSYCDRADFGGRDPFRYTSHWIFTRQHRLRQCSDFCRSARTRCPFLSKFSEVSGFYWHDLGAGSITDWEFCPDLGTGLAAQRSTQSNPKFPDSSFPNRNLELR
jgi:hypothetical protein